MVAKCHLPLQSYSSFRFVSRSTGPYEQRQQTPSLSDPGRAQSRDTLNLCCSNLCREKIQENMPKFIGYPEVL